MNVAIQTEEEFLCFYTFSIERAEEICKKANIEFTEMYEVQDDEMEFYSFDSRIWDTEYIEASK